MRTAVNRTVPLRKTGQARRLLRVGAMATLACNGAGLAVIPASAVQDERARPLLIKAARIEGMSETLDTITRERRLPNLVPAQLFGVKQGPASGAFLARYLFWPTTAKPIYVAQIICAPWISICRSFPLAA